MSSRIPLPRLSQRQRMARWQRERRQQTILTVVFSALLFFALGLVAWAAADRYYAENLRGVASVEGRVIPMRDFQKQFQFELVKFYVEMGVPPEFEDHPELASDKAQYAPVAMERVLEFAILDIEAEAAGVRLTTEQIDQAHQDEFGQYTARHILVAVPEDTPDEEREQAELFAAAKARQIAHRLRAAPMDQQLWNRLAEELSEDPGSKFSGGELGTVGKGRFVPEFEEVALRIPVGAISDPVKTQFGYHVIQVKQRITPEETVFGERLRASGFSEQDIRDQVRWLALREEFRERAREAAVTSPTEQVHLARIVIDTPAPTSGDPEGFIEGLRKVGEVGEKLREGVDFAEVAREHSDDEATRENGGDMGWIARGMLTDIRAEEVIFSLEPGDASEQFVGRNETSFYKVLDKDPARELTEEQRETLRQRAYVYWLEQKKLEHRAISRSAELGF